MDGLNQNERTVWKCWETKTAREVVREAAAKGTHIGLAHTFLEQKHDWDKQTASDWFTVEVYSWVLQLLSRKQYFKASHVLTKIKVSPLPHILKIANETPETELRNYLTEQLMKSNDELVKEQPDEWKKYLEDWKLLNLLEKSFECHGILSQASVFGTGKEIIIVNYSDLKKYTVESFGKFPIEWKQKVAASLFLDTFDFSIIHFLDREYLWNVLIEKNMVILLRRWIALSNCKEKYLQHDTLMIDKNALKVDTHMLECQETLQKVDDLFTRWPVTISMIENVIDYRCFTFTKMCILDAMCAFGYLIDSEKNDLKAILRRLSRTQNLHNIDKIFSKHDATFKNHLNNMLADYSVDTNYFQVMTTCVESDLMKKNIADLKNKDTENCLDLWLLFKAVQESKNVSNYVHAVHETCRFLSKSNMFQNHLIILGMILFSDTQLFGIFAENKMLTIDNININVDEPLSNLLPHLYSVYQRWKTDSLIIVNDVTVYQLLSGYKGLDISKVFEFQFSSKKKNVLHLTKKKTSNYLDEFPHCNNANLIRKFAYDKKLNYLYYLRQNRPCMASQVLLIQQYQAFRRLNVSMLRDACAQAHALALRNWNDNVITSSCVAFITMIGCDAMRCRTHVACAHMLATHFEEVEILTKDETNQRIDDIVAQIIENKPRSLLEILKTLEDTYFMHDNVYVDYFSVDNFGSMLYEWQTIIKFAYFHKLPLPISPLKHFASKNLWLPFFIFADVFNYSLHEILNLCHNFTDPALAEHVKQCVKSQIFKSGNQLSNTRYHKNRDEDLDEPPLQQSDDSINFSTISDDLWEIMAVCHGPEDPPAALIKASAAFQCPILALLATCYEVILIEELT